MRRLPISTRVVATVLVVGLALVWGRAAEWCVWWQAALAAIGLIAVGVLTIREGNRARIKDQKMLDAQKAELQATRATIEEREAESVKRDQRLRQDMLRGFSEARQLQEQVLEASDPSYERPQVPQAVHLGGNIVGGAGKPGGRLQVTPASRRQRLRLRLIYIGKKLGGRLQGPPASRRQRLWLRLIYIGKWVGGTHDDAPPA